MDELKKFLIFALPLETVLMCGLSARTNIVWAADAPANWSMAIIIFCVINAAIIFFCLFDD